ncbi:MAG: RNA methyltransferase [Clostridia bacterium]|nr:RNA methyltransferase [Clostridia bacterium]
MTDIIHITGLDIPELNVYTKLNENQLLNRDKPENGLFIAESPKVIERAIEAGYVPVSFLVETKRFEAEAKDIISKITDAKVYTADESILTELTGFKLTRGMLCAMKRKPLLSPESLLCNAHRVVILENIMNPTNVGALFRSAAALNLDAVILTSDCSNPLYRRAIRVSMGAVFKIPWTIADEELSGGGKLAALCKEHGFCTAAFALDSDTVSVTSPELKKSEKLAFFLGSEGDGLSKATIQNCNFRVKIPIYNDIDSLNVSVAGAIAFYELSGRDT